jgi:hypothetical protein
MRDAVNEVDAIPTHVPPHDTIRPPSSAMSDNARITELEFENARLQRLIAELLLKNQQLRKRD